MGKVQHRHLRDHSYVYLHPDVAPLYSSTDPVWSVTRLKYQLRLGYEKDVKPALQHPSYKHLSFHFVTSETAVSWLTASAAHSHGQTPRGRQQGLLDGNSQFSLSSSLPPITWQTYRFLMVSIYHMPYMYVLGLGHCNRVSETQCSSQERLFLIADMENSERCMQFMISVPIWPFCIGR